MPWYEAERCISVHSIREIKWPDNAWKGKAAQDPRQAELKAMFHLHPCINPCQCYSAIQTAWDDTKRDSQSRQGAAQIPAAHFGPGNTEFEASFLKTSIRPEKASGGEKQTKIHIVMRNYLTSLVCTGAEVEPHPNLTIWVKITNAKPPALSFWEETSAERSSFTHMHNIAHTVHVHFSGSVSRMESHTPH